MHLFKFSQSLPNVLQLVSEGSDQISLLYSDRIRFIDVQVPSKVDLFRKFQIGVALEDSPFLSIILDTLKLNLKDRWELKK